MTPRVAAQAPTKCIPVKENPTIVLWRREQCIPYARNARVIPNSAVSKVAASIKEFGFKQPIVVDAEGIIIAGHTRLLAAERLGLEKVPVLVADDLTPAQAKAYRLADNRTGQEATWDEALLQIELEDLAGLDIDLSLTGFDTEELLALKGGPETPIVEDEAPEPPEEPISKLGDLWLLGKHRVLCGDSRDAGAMEILVDGQLAECIWTDPPYGVDYVGKNRDAKVMQNDDKKGLSGLLSGAFAVVDAVLEPLGPFYVAAPAGPQGTTFRLAVRDVGWQFHQALVWVKDVLVLGHADYHYRHEDILYGWKAGTGRAGRGKHEGSRWHGDNSQTTVIEIPRPKRSAEHPTMKPVGLVAYCLGNSTLPGAVVLDPFLGSGSTLIAAEQTNRICYGMEIDPRYCDVIVQRWENLTGKKATRGS